MMSLSLAKLLLMKGFHSFPNREGQKTVRSWRICWEFLKLGPKSTPTSKDAKECMFRPVF